MVNVAEGFDDTSSVINGATDLLNAVTGDGKTHARSAVGVVLPNNWAVEVELVAELRPRAEREAERRSSSICRGVS
jgi:enamine deaminase RidA (YjgF/YER057c/UK114 family)